jgi:hypothetical protein
LSHLDVICAPSSSDAGIEGRFRTRQRNGSESQIEPEPACSAVRIAVVAVISDDADVKKTRQDR